MDSTENFLLKGNDNIEDTYEKSLGLSGGKMKNLFDGRYSMDTYTDNVMIRKGVTLRKESFDILKNWSHPVTVPLLNFYSESGNMGRLVVPPLDDTFTSWFEDKGVKVLFDEDGRMSKLFRDFIIELCEMVKSLHMNGIIMKNGIVREDLYVKIFPSGGFKILVLLTEVEKSYQHSEIRKNWNSIQDLINWCCRDSVQLHPHAECFKRFIGKPTCSVEKLRQYPDNWDYDTKGQYLMALKSAGHNEISSILRLIDFSWPEQLPDQLTWIIERSRNKGYHYNPPAAFDYLKLLWDSYKHFEKNGLYLKFVDREGFLKAIDIWSSSIWIVLYERIGWP